MKQYQNRIKIHYTYHKIIIKTIQWKLAIKTTQMNGTKYQVVLITRKRFSEKNWTLQETHRNSTSYARDEARTSERLLDRQTP